MEEKNLIGLPVRAFNYLKHMKNNNYTLIDALTVCIYGGVTKDYMEDYFSNCYNQEKFALAWVNGCKVEEKIFLVKVKNCAGACYLNYSIGNKNFFFSDSQENERYKTKFTKTFLEENSFGWVFSSEGVELIEVDE